MTLDEVKAIEFEVVRRGYKCDEVEKYIDTVAQSMQQLTAQNEDLLYKIQILADKIEEYKKDEESIREALLGAQKLGSTVLAEAKSKAETVIKEANATAEEVVSQAKARAEFLIKDSVQKASIESTALKKAADSEQKNLELMKKEVSNFKTTILNMYRTHLDLLANLPEASPARPKATERQKQEVEPEKKQEAEQPQQEQINEEKEKPQIANEQTLDTQQAQKDSLEQTKEFEGEPLNESDAQKDKKEKKDYSWKFGELKFGGNSDKL